MFFEYVIVGGGLSGATLGYLLKKNGANVAIIERQSLLKKKKLCGGILTPKTYKLLIDIFPQNEIDLLIQNHFTSCFIKTDFAVREAKGIDLKIVHRKELDDYLIQKYQSIGGEVFEKCLISKIDFENNKIFTNQGEICYQKIIGADGVFSQVRKELTGKRQKSTFGIESFQPILSDIKIPVVEFKQNYLGYSLFMPVGKEFLLGTGGFVDREECVKNFKSMALRYGMDSSTWQGGFTPTGEDIFLEDKNIYFIGDAAGLIHPLTGEGIFYALTSVKELFDSFINQKSYSDLMSPTILRLEEQVKHASSWIKQIKENPYFLLFLNFCNDNHLTQALLGVFD